MSTHKFYTLILALAALSVMIGVTAVVPSFRQSAKERLISYDRTVLAKAEGDVTGKGDNLIVVKVKTPDSLSLEIYFKTGEKDEASFQKRLILPEKRDGFFTFHGRETNLVMADIDHDGTLEILAPAFDENLIPRLNVYKYDQDSRSFQKMGADSLNL
jgi:hypothetical protein